MDVVDTRDRVDTSLLDILIDMPSSSEAFLASTDALMVQNEIEDGAQSMERSSCGDQSKEPMRNPSRDRFRAEMASLREQIVQLEEQKGLLEHKHEIQTHVVSATSVLWKSIAQMQSEWRLQTERENEHLKQALDTQFRIVKQLEDALLTKPPATDLPSTRQAKDSEGIRHVYLRYIDEVQRAYEHVDVALHWSDGKSSGGQWVERTVADESGSALKCVEIRDQKWLPFELSRVFNALWRAMVNDFAHSDPHGETSFAEPECFVNRRLQRDGLLVSETVMKKFVQQDRMAIVWRSVNNLRESLGGIGDRVFSTETGWVVVERVRGVDAESSTRARTCARHFPQWDSDAESILACKTDTFVKLAMGSTQDDIAIITEAVENILLEDVLSTPHGDV
ncbi:hypothetical protein Poli38472_004978 [Pythium oligandrum]|uniref:Uncharacterized protein n=1 Tax=Pythium oligandrum TaxID=41045 RepID=A0A8K1FGD7_PYTOL|nr:hypothetical protein Poli38472_004978 [Pythium oligandrum]|eukprot:TMW59909.1 hypothetical protein Poli38472_004978 [Pythium oligandrum]